MFTYFVAGEDKSHRLRRISVEQRPLLADPAGLHPLTARSVTTSSTPSLRSLDSGTDTDGLQLLFNGSVPFIKGSHSYQSLESQV